MTEKRYLDALNHYRRLMKKIEQDEDASGELALLERLVKTQVKPRGLAPKRTVLVPPYLSAVYRLDE